MENSKLKHEHIKVASPIQVGSFQDITNSLVNRDLGGGCKLQRKALVFLRKVDHRHIGPKICEGNRNAPVRALHNPNPFTCDLSKIGGKPAQSASGWRHSSLPQLWGSQKQIARHHTAARSKHDGSPLLCYVPRQLS
jgi:hypothetical protein